ncbi:MAG: glycosyltransferase family 2 protein [Ardenticatenia bacterium]|nr:glycosyltransferase family 2 protein [Ardenticatenia bacterium]
MVHNSTTTTHTLKVPVNDPEAALRFCRALANFLEQPINTPTALSTPEISVVLPVYNEQENLSVLYRRLKAALDGHVSSYELIFVNDGSTDESASLLEALAFQDNHVVVVELARNFGHQAAISAGLDFARGRATVIMDADLQDPPEIVPKLIAKWREGYDVVYAIRQQRKEHWPKRLAYALFYRLLRWLAHVDIPLDAGDFCIMDRRVVKLLQSMPERNRFVRGIRSWVGLRQIGMPYERDARYAGRSKYTVGRLMVLALDGIISFSYAPLRVASLLGISISLLSFAIAIFYFVKKLTTGLNPPGFATLVVAIFFLAGIQLITIGVMGEYVGRIFDEVKRRPIYVVRRILHRPQEVKRALWPEATFSYKHHRHP